MFRTFGEQSGPGTPQDGVTSSPVLPVSELLGRYRASWASWQRNVRQHPSSSSPPIENSNPESATFLPPPTPPPTTAELVERFNDLHCRREALNARSDEMRRAREEEEKRNRPPIKP